MNNALTADEALMLRTISGWARGSAPELTNVQVRLCEGLEARGLLSPQGAGLYGWPWRLTDAGRRAA